MLPDPLHPAVVHFPIVLTLLLPLVALGALWAIRGGAAPLKAWGAVVALGGGLLLSSWAAVRTGEAQEERVEEVVSEAAMHGHEEAGERFLLLAGIGFLVLGAGLVPGIAGRTGRILGTAAALALVAAAWQVGHTGGELVYRHGAAVAYAGSAGPEGAVGERRLPGGGDRPRTGSREDDEEGDEGDRDR